MKLDVPENWSCVELDSAFDFANGINFSADQRGSGVLTIDVKNMYSDRLCVDTSNLYRVDVSISDKRLVSPEDILFVRSSVKEEGVGWPALFGGHSEPVAYCGFIIRGRPKGNLFDPRFLVYYLRQGFVRKQVVSSSGKTALTNISQEKLKQLVVPLPPLSEQKRIAAILDQADAIRRKRRKAIELTEQFLKSAFLDMFGSWLEEPRAEMRRLGDPDMAEVVSGVTKGRRFNGRETVVVPYIRVANVQDGFLDLAEIKTIEALPSDVDSLSLQRGDVLMTEGGDFDKLGRGAMWEADVPGCIHQNHVFRIRCNPESLLPEYFAGYIQTGLAKAYFLKCAKKTSNLASINMTQLRATPVPCPPIKLQAEFARLRETQQRITATKEAAISTTDNLFNSLVQRAFRGEL